MTLRTGAFPDSSAQHTRPTRARRAARTAGPLRRRIALFTTAGALGTPGRPATRRPPYSAQLSPLALSPQPPTHPAPAGARPRRAAAATPAPPPARLPALTAAAAAPWRGAERFTRRTTPRGPPAPGGRPPRGPHQGGEVLPGEVRLPQCHSRLVPRHLGRKRKRGCPRGRLTPRSLRRRLRHARHSPPAEARSGSGTLHAGRRGAALSPAARRERLRRGAGQPRGGSRRPHAG